MCSDCNTLERRPPVKRVTIRVPATSANLGPGFDSFGLALNLYNNVTLEETASGLTITGCSSDYANPWAIPFGV